MKVLAICGSPRKGNTEWMLNKTVEYLRAGGAEVEVLLLRRKSIKMCTGCLTCAEGGDNRPGICRVKDDMAGIFPALIKADVILMATPVYFSMLSGLLKNFMDRTCPIWVKLNGKGMAGIAVAADDCAAAIPNLKTYASLCSMKWVGGVTALAYNTGEAEKVPGLEKRLKRLAGKILKSANE